MQTDEARLRPAETDTAHNADKDGAAITASAAETAPESTPADPDLAERRRLLREEKRRRYLRNKRRHQMKQALALCILLGLLLAIIFGIRACSRLVFGGRTETIESEDTSASVSEQTALPGDGSAQEADETPDPRAGVPTTTVTLMAVGDNLMHNTVMEAGHHLDDDTYDFLPLYTDMAADIQAADIACINQETIYINDPKQYTNYPAFGGPTAIGEALVELGFDVVTHATNHVYDKGETGVLDTIAFWKTHPEITYLGIHDSAEDAEEIRVVEKNDIRIAMLNYTYGVNYSTPAQDYMIDFLDDKDAIADDIARAKELSDIVIVFMHIGTEYQYTANEDQIEWAQFFADQGVGAVIGGHPHVVEPLEYVTGKDGNEMPVFYSLGNFISHQDQAPRLLGAMANLTIEKDGYGTRVTDCSMTPLVTYIRKGGENGKFGYAFNVMRLEDYTDEMAANHIISGMTPDALWELYNSIVGES